MKWWTRAMDDEHDIAWYICNTCKAAGADSTQAIQHHEHCSHVDNGYHDTYHPRGSVYNPEADEWCDDYIDFI